ncbi:MAG: type 1 glutamine amidotransferase [Spirochaetota bacterium]
MNDILILKNISREGPGILDHVLFEQQVDSVTVDLDAGETLPPTDDFSALIVLGGPDSANDLTPKIQSEIAYLQQALEGGMPCLGICLGLQLLVKAAGGSVVKSPQKEVGFFSPDGIPYTVDLTGDGMRDPLTDGIESPFRVFQLHGETVVLTGGMTLLGTGNAVQNQIVRYGRSAYGIQCHFELTRQMLAEWCAQDDDLKQLDSSMLLEQFSAIEEAYTQVGRTLFTNFVNTVRMYPAG